LRLVWEMVHPWPSLATTAAAGGFGLLLGLGWSDPRLGAIMATVLMTQLSISTLNDWADRARDAAAGRKKPLVLGHLPSGVALGLAILFALFTLPGMLAFGAVPGIVVLIGLASGWFYDLWAKPTPFSFLPFAIAFPLLPTWVGLIAGRPPGSFAWLVIAGAFLAVAIHLADGLPDIETDAAAEIRPLAVALGRDQSIRVMLGCALAGSLVVVAALASRPLIAIAVGVTALVAVSLLARVARTRPAHARWIAAMPAVVAAVALLPRIDHA